MHFKKAHSNLRRKLQNDNEDQVFHLTMTAAKGAQKNKDQTTKSVTWFGKWIPDNFAKKAQEAFKLLERAIFSDEYVDDKEQLKIKKLENQLKSLQDKVDQLANIKPTRPASTSSTQSVKKATSKDKTKVTSQNKEPPAQTRIQIRVPDSPKHNKKIPPPPPPPVKVVSVMTSSSATVVSGHTVPPRPPPPAQPVKALPFSASDLQVKITLFSQFMEFHSLCCCSIGF
jgi:hypothetical protein